MVRKIAGYILSPIHYIAFGLILLIFHPIQWVCLKLGGYNWHKTSVDILNLCLISSYYILGNSVRFTNQHDLPTDRPILFVSNHQSMYDIPPLIYFLRKHHAKFISKIELTKGIPSISFNLKYGGGANIDRKDSKQSIAEILKLANRMKEKNWSAVIFPEGTRAKSANIKPFSGGGIATIIKKVPNVLVVPIAINNSCKVVQYGAFPLGTFNKMSWTVLDPIEPKDLTIDEIVSTSEDRIRDYLTSRPFH
ncbi:lysophospholipid acyltransferase family protein [Albibacterium indicum]|uniref:lysophospholipid acyltransferase family protein n=1 Tax=Albibacterium indicum TaxID=2292082 RepID=UPI000E48141B|nr:lysophospholipid acyltransferase family protein [Pedobacter indicus]